MYVFMMGDSVFDNAAYLRSDEPDVRKQVAALLPTQARVFSVARDGAVISSIRTQLGRMPSDVTHIVVSAGGNDALQASHVLDAPAASVAAALQLLARIADAFRGEYAGLLDDLTTTRLPVALCTIYEPRFADAQQRRTATTALSVLNDAITREAFMRGFELMDLRLVCNDDQDFANPIEPSARGGEKIAGRIVDFATGARPRAQVFA